MEAVAVLREVLEAFEKENSRYCLLRNYEFLLDKNIPPESLDTAIAKDDLPKVDSILRSFGFSQRTQQFSLVHKAYFRVLGLQKVSFDIQVGGIHWNDMPYLGEEIFSRRKKEAFFSILSDEDYCVMLLAHSLLGKRYFKPKYQRIITTLLTKNDINKEHIRAELSRIFSTKIADRLLRKGEQGDFSSIHPAIPLLTFVCKQPQRIITLGGVFFRWLKQRKNPFQAAPFISIVGPDGAGKSTLVHAVRKALQQTGRTTAIVYLGRGRGTLLPISRLGRAYKHAEKKRDAQHVGKQRKKYLRKLLYLATAPIFAADLYARYLFRILPRRLRRNIVITDRYCSDLLLMPHVPWQVKKSLASLFPKPTLSIFLHNTPEVLQARRPEESIEELQRQLAIFNRQEYSLRLKTEEGKKDSEKVITFVLTELMKRWW